MSDSILISQGKSIFLFILSGTLVVGFSFFLKGRLLGGILLTLFIPVSFIILMALSGFFHEKVLIDEKGVKLMVLPKVKVNRNLIAGILETEIFHFGWNEIEKIGVGKVDIMASEFCPFQEYRIFFKEGAGKKLELETGSDRFLFIVADREFWRIFASRPNKKVEDVINVARKFTRVFRMTDRYVELGIKSLTDKSDPVLSALRKGDGENECDPDGN